MQTLFSATHFAADPQPCVLAAGFFDGMHRGHRRVIEDARAAACEAGLAAWGLSFDRHPLAVLAPDRQPRLLTPLPQRLELLAQTGLDGCLMLPFTPALAALEPEAFVRALCEPAHRLKAVFCGANWRFGCRGEGSPEVLASVGRRYGFTVRVVPEARYAGRPISSTRIRRTIQTGQLEMAAEMLGRPYTIRETVVHGRGVGRRMGMATANLHPGAEVLPPVGVYLVATWLGDRRIDGVANLGFRPTFNDAVSADPVLELHLLDFEGDLYGCVLDIDLIARLRDERRFDSPAALRRQIEADIREARTRLQAGYSPSMLR